MLASNVKWSLLKLKWFNYDLSFSKCIEKKKEKEKLHSKYVFASTEKAANNAMIIWKRYNADVSKVDLNSTITYVPAQPTKDKLFCLMEILSWIDEKLARCELPTFYRLPKLHKVNPAFHHILDTALLTFLDIILHPL